MLSGLSNAFVRDKLLLFPRSFLAFFVVMLRKFLKIRMPSTWRLGICDKFASYMMDVDQISPNIMFRMIPNVYGIYGCKRPKVLQQANFVNCKLLPSHVFLPEN